MKEIKLSNGMVTMVDDENYEHLNKFKWHSQKGRYTYYVIRHGNKENTTIRMHREIMNPQKKMEIDHIDHNGLNNQKYNLRICTRSENHMNEDHKGKLKGSYYERKYGLFKSRITHNGKDIFLGYYKTRIEAAVAYDRAALKYFGEYANLNFK